MRQHHSAFLIFASAILLTCTPPAVATQVTLIPHRSAWHYFDEITNGRSGTPLEDYPQDGLGRSWTDPAFDTLSSTPDLGIWKVGDAIIGAGNLNIGPIQTNVDRIDGELDGFSRITTLLFRKTFDVSSPDIAAGNLEVLLLADDAGILYLNGSEVLRYNLPDGPIATTTYATQAGNEDNYEAIALPSGLLRTGENHVAFELHNISDFNNDMGFDLALSSTVPEPHGLLSLAPIAWLYFRGRNRICN